MMQRIDEKIKQGFRCIKLKIGAINFDKELDMVKHIRERFSHNELEIRLDAMVVLNLMMLCTNWNYFHNIRYTR